MQYDSSVRNSENTVVQFTYGDDGLHPGEMEDNDRPVNFERLRAHVCETLPCHDEEPLRGQDLVQRVESKLSEKRFQSLLPTGKVLIQEIKEFFLSLVAKEKELVEGSEPYEQHSIRSWYSSRVTETQLEKIMQVALKKCLMAYVEPGEAIGAIGAQSISEPGTQMTLKVRQEREPVLCPCVQPTHPICLSTRRFTSVESAR